MHLGSLYSSVSYSLAKVPKRGQKPLICGNWCRRREYAPSLIISHTYLVAAPPGVSLVSSLSMAASKTSSLILRYRRNISTEA